MSKDRRRDDNHLDRLSSFLYQDGGLQSKMIEMIKSNVMLLTDESERKFIIKQHHNRNNVRQQWEFFSQIQSKRIAPFKRFPNGRMLLKDADHNCWTLTPFINGRKLNYRNNQDRLEAVKAIRGFHHQASNIIIKHPIKKRLFYLRWYNRLHTFKNTEPFFLKFGYEKLFQDIVRKTERYIELVSRYPWKMLQQTAEEKGLWVHGDVASHNFIHNERTYLIDFDLLSSTSQLYDYIQLGQRFLPYIGWDIEQLLAYHMVEERDIPVWLMSISIPSDVMREWLHFLSSHRTDQEIKTYLVKMEENWMIRTYFVKMARTMLK